MPFLPWKGTVASLNIADLRLPQVGKNKSSRDHVARGGEGALAAGGAPRIPGRYVSWQLGRLIVGIG